VAAESKNSARATVLVGIITAASGLLGYAIAGCQQSSQQNKSLTSQAREADTHELRGVVDEAGGALLRTTTALNRDLDPAPSSSPPVALPKDVPVRAATPSQEKAIKATRRKALEDGERYAGTMERAQARLTIRLGRLHPVTRAYNSARRGLLAQIRCRRFGTWVTPPSWTTTIASATREFNDRAAALLGSFVRGRPVADARTDTSQLDRLEQTIDGMERQVYQPLSKSGCLPRR
jgi:hypothetical protein